jgi:sensor histidine kinase YesM
MSEAPRVSWRVATAFAIVLTAVFAAQNLLATDVDPAVVFIRQAIIWGLWLALTPSIISAARRYPLEERPTWKWIRKQLLIGGGFALLHGFCSALIRWTLGVSVYPNLADAVLASMVANLGRDYLTYWFIAAVYQALIYHRAIRDRDAEAARLELDLVKARLETLEGRLRPHFLFNTLNTIAALIREDPTAAEAMLGQLSELLRASLRADPLREVRLGEELELVGQYLAIQQVRFQDRLRVQVDASDDARKAFVPHLILQPLVENAVRHGIAPREGPGTVFVHAGATDGRLRVTVEDDGVGMGNAPSQAAGAGLGLGSVRSRLEYIYGSAQDLEIVPRHPMGTIVSFSIPYRSEQPSNGGAHR